MIKVSFWPHGWSDYMKTFASRELWKLQFTFSLFSLFPLWLWFSFISLHSVNADPLQDVMRALQNSLNQGACFPPWSMYNSWTTLTKCDFCNVWVILQQVYALTTQSKTFFFLLCVLSVLFVFCISQNAIFQLHITLFRYHRSRFAPQLSIPYEYQTQRPSLNNWLCPIGLISTSVSVCFLYHQKRFERVCGCFLSLLNRMWGFLFSFSWAALVSSSLLACHFPITTETCKLPQRTNVDLFMFPTF